MRSKFFIFVFVLAGLFGLVSSAGAQDKNKGKELKAAVDRVDDAAEVVSEVMKIAEKSIPRDLLQKAKHSCARNIGDMGDGKVEVLKSSEG